MKNYIILLVSAILLTGCYSYKNVSPNEITTNKHYKIKTNTGKFKKIKIDSISENKIFYTKNRHIQSLEITEKSVLRVRKFSTIKTVLLPVGIVGGIILIVDHAMDNMYKNINIDIQPPL